MQDKLGEVYEGVISAVTEWGLYVELDENKCEGLVPVRDLADDYYDYDEKNFCLIGRKYHNKYTLGDIVRVQVARADLDKKQLDFALVADEGNPNIPLKEKQKLKAELKSAKSAATGKKGKTSPNEKRGKKEKSTKSRK